MGCICRRPASAKCRNLSRTGDDALPEGFSEVSIRDTLHVWNMFYLLTWFEGSTIGIYNYIYIYVVHGVSGYVYGDLPLSLPNVSTVPMTKGMLVKIVTQHLLHLAADVQLSFKNRKINQ